MSSRWWRNTCTLADVPKCMVALSSPTTKAMDPSFDWQCTQALAWRTRVKEASCNGYNQLSTAEYMQWSLAAWLSANTAWPSKLAWQANMAAVHVRRVRTASTPSPASLPASGRSGGILVKMQLALFKLLVSLHRAQLLQLTARHWAACKASRQLVHAHVTPSVAHDAC